MTNSYILCATPRTGSTLLCDLLTRCGLGAPDSYSMEDMDPAWAAELGMPVAGDAATPDEARAILDAGIRAGRNGGDTFGLRLMRSSLPRLCALIDLVHPGLATEAARLRSAFGDPLFLYLRREDKLAQAVSMVRAEQTGLWHVAPDGSELERLAPPQDPVYDAPRIAAKLAELTGHDAAWGDWFAREGVTPFPISYEALSADPAGTIGRICDALGQARPPDGHLQPGVARLADATSRDWMRRFREANPGV